ncbi:MAG TPA: hypothetical protein VN374_05160, partial [Desulfitobacteriaceae bacterium]|nr:hypothetical protein [Desulfitobacteriaceae bacterium]
MRINRVRRGQIRSGTHWQAVLLLLTMTLFLFIPFGTKASLNTNPPLKIINDKIETIARSKGIPTILLKAVAFRES